ncbi:caspase family protein [Candidatus Woesearchaeota archaeon]|nr:caspase family protein [Candidatus Woesearchaeota archaeon]
MGLETIINGNGTAALRLPQGSLTAAGEKVGGAIGSGLETLARAGYHGLHAANPFRDASNFLKAGYHLLKDEKSLKEYFSEAKKGKFLGKGNLSTVAFYGGLVASGLYLPLLVTRAAIGAGGYVGKSMLTTDYVKNKVVGFLDRNKKYISRLGSILGLNRGNTERALSKRNMEKLFAIIKDDKLYRQKIAPYVMDAAIGLKGYASLVGAKWFSGTIGKGAEKLAKNTKYKSLRFLANKVAGVGNFGKNASGDLLSLLVAIQGGTHFAAHGPDGFMDDLKQKYHYVKDGKFIDDAKNYVAGLFGFEKRGPEHFREYRFVPPRDDDSDRPDRHEPERPYEERPSEPERHGPEERPAEPERPEPERRPSRPDPFPFPEFPEFPEFDKPEPERHHEREHGREYRRHDPIPPEERMKDINNHPADTPLPDNHTPQEKYAVVVAGFDAEHKYSTIFGGYGPLTRERFLIEQVRIYNQLLEQGFKKENIYVLIPDGLDPKNPTSHYPEGFENLREAYRDYSYSHDATEANLERILRHMGKKVDSNDTFVLYLSTHGNLHRDYSYNGDGDFTTRENSFAALDNGKDKLHDWELRNYAKGINGGREVYIINACHSGHFAKTMGVGRDIAFAASMMHQPGVLDDKGYSYATFLLDALKSKGGLNSNTKVKTLFESLQEGMRKFKHHYRYCSPGRAQTPCFGTGDDARRFDWYRVPARGAAPPSPSPAPAVVPAYARAA